MSIQAVWRPGRRFSRWLGVSSAIRTLLPSAPQPRVRKDAPAVQLRWERHQKCQRLTGAIWMANHAVVAGSPSTIDRPPRRKSATSFSLPGFGIKTNPQCNMNSSHGSTPFSVQYLDGDYSANRVADCHGFVWLILNIPKTKSRPQRRLWLQVDCLSITALVFPPPSSVRAPHSPWVSRNLDRP
jgi:hypothetical protein